MTRGRYPRRIKLRELDPVRIDRYLDVWDPAELHFHPDSFPLLDSASLFDLDGPLSLEIGCGTGEFLCELARRNPKELYLGLDNAYKPLVRSATRADSLGLDNIRFLRADVRQVFSRLRRDSLYSVYLQFPVPGSPAQRYRPQIFNQVFVCEIYRALVPDGRLSVITDRRQAHYAMLHLIQEVGGFERVCQADYPFQLDRGLQSHNYRIWTERGYRPFRFEVTKSTGMRMDHGT